MMNYLITFYNERDSKSDFFPPNHSTGVKYRYSTSIAKPIEYWAIELWNSKLVEENMYIIIDS